jgi:hypothetical protein
MFHRLRAFLLSLTIIAVLAFSTFGTTVVYADGDTPPKTTEQPETVTVDTIDMDKTVPTVAPEDGGGSVEEAATPVPTEEVAPPVEETATAVPTEEVAPPATAEPTEVVEVVPPVEETGGTHETTPTDTKPLIDTPVLDTVPENTTVAVVNAAGELQPLATQAAADAIATSDPIWCPAGQTPTPGTNGCTQSFTSFTALLTFLAGNASYTGAGTIYVQQGAYQGGESTVDFNNYNLSNISSSDLTITGGWNTSTGVIDPANSSTFTGVSIIIGTSTNPWGGSLTLNNLTLNNPSGTGLNLNTQSNVVLTNVNVTNSTNGAGTEINAGGNVTIENSKFERNKTAGAIIRAVGGVAIATSSFSTPETARRQITGLDIISDGDVSLFQVLASGNRQANAKIDAAGRVTIVDSVFNSSKSMMGSDFLGYGLTVVSQDAIDLDGVTANDNFLWGASLTAAGDVTIANSSFNANTTESDGFIDDTGLLVTSGGNVSIANSHADDNRLIGATIDAVGDVSISGSTFSGNNGTLVDSAGGTTFYGYGLQVVTDGNISLSGVTASNNTLFGAHLESGLDVTVATSDFSNQASTSTTDLTGRGLEIISGGNVFLDTVTLNNNQTFGADIKAADAVFLNAVTASGNGTNGVEVETNCGTLFLIGGTYSDNGQYGLSVLSTAINQTIAPVFANNVAGNIFENPGTCNFTAPPTTPVTPPAPPVYQPNDLGAITARVPAKTADGKTVQYFENAVRGLSTFSGGALIAVDTVTLNSFAVTSGLASHGTHLGIFTGKYAYLHLSSGLQIVVYSPSSINELAMNGS